MIQVRTTVQTILRFGPTRVMISPEETAGCHKAREEHGINPDVIFIRNDGWSLGAPKSLAEAAERLWKDYWVGVMLRPRAYAYTYQEYLSYKATVGL